ncbi:anti-sigma factor domain-containing protein [Streptomyces sp. NPDC017993]|uniref:anti-sigma factor n=1 Tax=Streptomyces sp. NPDC017993 TaxID=3365027 RepID=UPI0037B3A75A
MTSADLHTLTGAYAVNALPEAEAREFERHLSDCEGCAQEVRELAATAERLGRAMAVVPPPEMKERVLRRVSTVRQEPPRVARGGRRAAGPTRRARRLPRWALAACLAAAAAFGGVAVWQHGQAVDARDQAQRTEQRAESVARVLTAPDARVTNGKVGDAGTGTVVVSRSRNRAAFLVSGLPRPAEGTVYQLWFNDGGTMRPAGLLDPGRADAAVLMDGGIDRASGMGVTVEPAGGSPQPTTKPIALMSFTGV